MVVIKITLDKSKVDPPYVLRSGSGIAIRTRDIEQAMGIVTAMGRTAIKRLSRMR